MQREIKCPNCQKVFTIDEASYAEIQKQVYNAEFKHELESRLNDIKRQNAKDLDAIKQQNAKDIEIAKRDTAAKYQQELSDTKTKYQQTLSDTQAKYQRAINDAKSKYQQDLNSAEAQLRQELNQREQQISKLEAQIANANTDKKLAVTEATTKLERECDNYKSELEKSQALSEKNELMLRQSFNDQLRIRDEEIERLKDMKSKLNTKMIGESLEQHCRAEYDKFRFAYPRAVFEKDTEGASKGDFIFRNYDEDGNEIVSIMFEMKNQTDDAITKQKRNSDHFKKLDLDRANKNCEYAVLVSLLEPDDEYYNMGIVTVHEYDKMYAIRPQFFIQIISLINNLAQDALGYKAELARIHEQNIDIENFEARLGEWRKNFNTNSERATKNFLKAIEGIDKSIKDMKAVREALVKTVKNFGIAEKKLESLDIRKLASGNETMTKMFADLELAEENNSEDELEA